jgi:branched-chain amino acid transport system permease protein
VTQRQRTTNSSVRRGTWLTSASFLLRALLLVVLLVWPLLYESPYAMRVMTTGGLYVMLTVAVVVILGQAGQLSFAHAAFYGMGAYTAAILTM